MKLKTILFTLLISLQACAYLNVRVPLDKDVENTQLGNKVGRASMQSIMGLVSWGDSGTEAAAKAGGISVIKHMDREYYMIFFGAYAKATTIVYGD